MDYRVLGRTGVKVSPIGLGTGNFADPTPEDESARIINRALDAGINLIDTGNSYANGDSERFIGRALAASGRRNEAFLATKAFYKVGPGPNDEGLSRLHLIRACETRCAGCKPRRLTCISFTVPRRLFPSTKPWAR